jgi:hypothetical protein
MIHSKSDLLGLKKFDIKYGSEGFEIRNNCPYRHFSRFIMDFELKFEQCSKIQIQMEFDWIFFEA